MEAKERQVKLLELENGFSPFEDWVKSLDKGSKARVVRRVGRLRLGNFGDWQSIGEGIFELRLDFGPGYRVYYAQYEQKIIVLVGGGNKKTQQKDIQQAKELWKKFRDETTRFQREFS